MNWLGEDGSTLNYSICLHYIVGSDSLTARKIRDNTSILQELCSYFSSNQRMAKDVELLLTPQFPGTLQQVLIPQ